MSFFKLYLSLFCELSSLDSEAPQKISYSFVSYISELVRAGTIRD